MFQYFNSEIDIVQIVILHEHVETDGSVALRYKWTNRQGLNRHLALVPVWGALGCFRQFSRPSRQEQHHWIGEEKTRIPVSMVLFMSFNTYFSICLYDLSCASLCSGHVKNQYISHTHIYIYIYEKHSLFLVALACAGWMHIRIWPKFISP